MDSDVSALVEKLKETRARIVTSQDANELEKCFQEMKTELFLKRVEVANLRGEMERTDEEMQQLRKCLSKTKRESDEANLGLSLLQNRMRTVEDELRVKSDALARIQFQFKSTVAENDTLKEDHQRLATQNLELRRSVDMLEGRQKHETTYCNEILKRDAQLKRVSNDLQEVFRKLQSEQSKAIELVNSTKSAEESLEISQRLAKQNGKLKEERDCLEKRYITVNAKFEKLQSLLNNDNELNGPNVFSKMVFNLWKQSQQHFTEQFAMKNEILAEITDQLAKQTEINIKLIKENECLSSQLTVMEKEVDLLKQLKEVKIKEEPIVLD